jgi:predicted metalloprotease with PDZ domain
VAAGLDNEHLVAALGHDDWRRRQAAYAELRRRGVKAMDAVSAGFRSKDEEISTRCADLLRLVGRPALAALEPWAASEHERRLRDRARSLLIQIRGKSWMGVHIRDVMTEELGTLGLRTSRGAWITRVLEETPAQAAGFRANDFIVEFDGVEIEDTASLILAVGSTTARKKCQVHIIRAGKRQALPITLRPMPKDIDPRTGLPVRAAARRRGVPAAPKAAPGRAPRGPDTKERGGGGPQKPEAPRER